MGVCCASFSQGPYHSPLCGERQCSCSCGMADHPAKCIHGCIRDLAALINQPVYNPRPHRCPVCKGRGSVKRDFYGPARDLADRIKCRSCKGEGVLWR